MRVTNSIFLIFLAIMVVEFSSCTKDPVPPGGSGTDGIEVRDSHHPLINDDYSAIAEQLYSGSWGPYNLHDPTIVHYDAIEGAEILYHPEQKMYYLISQGRLGSHKYLMNLHVRRLEWSTDGWPLVSPERFANVPDLEIEAALLVGNWEQIDLYEATLKNISFRISFSEQGRCVRDKKIETITFNS